MRLRASLSKRQVHTHGEYSVPYAVEAGTEPYVGMGECWDVNRSIMTTRFLLGRKSLTFDAEYSVGHPVPIQVHGIWHLLHL